MSEARKCWNCFAHRSELTTGIHDQLIFLSVLNIFLSITAFLGNTLILVALHKETSLHPPSKLLYRTLAITDLCVGTIVEPLRVVYLISVVKERWNVCRYAFVACFTAGYILCGVSLLTSTAISVDRLLALLLGLRYRQVVTLKRTYLFVTVFWVVSILTTTMHFWNYLITAWCSYLTISLCLVTSIVCYTKIFLTFRHRQIQVQGTIHGEQPNKAIPVNIARYRKAVSSALSVQMALVVCYLPQGIVQALIIQMGLSLSVFLAREFMVCLLYLNSSLNPVVYCWKMNEVRQAAKATIRDLCCSRS